LSIDQADSVGCRREEMGALGDGGLKEIDHDGGGG
jgi:hypothetical protein